MSGEVSTEARTALQCFLQGIIHDVVIITEHSRRQTATVMDVLLALKRRGRCARTATHIALGSLPQSHLECRTSDNSSKTGERGTTETNVPM